jgi:hypothetical protein
MIHTAVWTVKTGSLARLGTPVKRWMTPEEEDLNSLNSLNSKLNGQAKNDKQRLHNKHAKGSSRHRAAPCQEF